MKFLLSFIRLALVQHTFSLTESHCYCAGRLFTLQQALKIDKKSEDAVKLLMSLMDWLEKKKTEYADNDAITNEIAAQAHIENYALKLFLWADGQDRAAIFNK